MRLTVVSSVTDAHDDAIWAAAWASSSNQLVTGSVDEAVKVWQEADDKIESLHTYTGHSLGVVCVGVDHTGTYAASSALDSFIRVWSLKDNTTKAVIETPPSETWSINFHPKNSNLIGAAGGTSNKVVLWNTDNIDPKEARPEQSFAVPLSEDGSKSRKEKFVLSVCFSPDGRRMASGSHDGTVAVFDVESEKFLHKLDGHFKPVRSLTFTPDSKCLLTACDDMHSHFYDVENKQLIEAFSGHESWVLTVSCHPEGSAFATGSSDCKVKLWDLNTRTCAQTVTEHTDQVWAVAFRPDGSRLASVADDKSIRLFDFS